MKNAPIQLFNSVAASGSVNSPGIYLANMYVYSMHGIWGAGGTGSIVIQASNDDVPFNINGTSSSSNVVNWAPIAGGTMTVSGAGSSLLNFDGIGYLWVRAAFVTTGGTSATVVLNYFGKGT